MDYRSGWIRTHAAMNLPLPDVATLSRLDRPAFVALLGGVYECSPWIAERAWQRRPFGDRAALQQALAQSLAAASKAEQLALIRVHPELAGKASVRGELTVDSRREQAGAGLDRCSPEEFEEIQRLNRDYGQRFGFPFIIAVKGLGRQDILAAMRRRIGRTPAEEFAEALAQVDRIAALRLADLVAA